MAEECVRVAVRVRPLLQREILGGHRECIRLIQGSPQVMLEPNKVFSFDYAYGPEASQDEVYDSCVQPLLETLLEGYNATVFCYGQTGSGKTYTLGGGHLNEDGGIAERVAQDLFTMLEQKMADSDGLETKVTATYLELYKEELRDLLKLSTAHKELHIRENEMGNIVVVGAKEVDATSAEDILNIIEMGNVQRHTASTGMNESSSRSHSILTLQLDQSFPDNASIKSSKLCLVDLAGSERVDQTGNTGDRLKESVLINTGLLALAKVIRALCNPARNSTAHIPYRDAKLTRLLRDSLGGTARTVMMACVSPSHRSVSETLNVLHFAAKARRIQNCPKVTRILRDKKRGWDYGVAGGGNSFTQPGQMNQEETSQYRLLVHEAAVLLEEFTGLAITPHFKHRLQEWQDRLRAVDNLHQEARHGQNQNVPYNKHQKKPGGNEEALTVENQLSQQKDAELRKAQEEIEKLLEENKIHLRALEEEKEHSRIQTERLVDQQLLISRLRGDLMALRCASGAKEAAESVGNVGRRAQSVPLMRQSCRSGTPRRIHSSPPAYSLERVMAAFKVRGHLLLAEIEEEEEVYCPFIKRQAESDGRDRGEQQAKVKGEEEEKDSTEEGRLRRRYPLNQTWTNRQKMLTLKKKDTGPERTSDGGPSVQQPHRDTGSEVNVTQSQGRKARPKVTVTQRRIQDLTVNMRMKEELMKALNTTDNETRAVDLHGKEGDALMRLSLQMRKVQSEVYFSLQDMKLQRQQLQSSLRETAQNEEENGKHITVSKSNHMKGLEKKFLVNSWLEKEEERVLEKRAELQELEEELKRREEVILQRENCLQEKNKLEMKRLRSSQALSQDLLRASLQLESVEEEMRRQSNVRQTGGVTREELERERETLKRRRDALDAQLNDDRVLSAEEQHTLLELEEAIEALDAALEFKNHSIQDKQSKLSISDCSAHQSQSTEPAQLCDVVRKLKKLSPPEALDLLVRYFNKVVYLREVERRLRLRCEELQINVEEREVVVKKMKEAMQRLALDADRKITQQHKDHQNNIQLLLQKLREGRAGEAQKAFQERLQHLEKELFFYKSSSRQLKKKLKDLHSNALCSGDQPSHSQDHRRTHANKSQRHSEEVQTKTHIVTTYTKIHSEQPDQQTQSISHLRRCSRQTPFDLQVSKDTGVAEHPQMQTSSQGERVRGVIHSGGFLEMEPVRLCRRELRQISAADLQVRGSSTGRRQSTLDTSLESVLEDSIEVSKTTDG